MLHEWVLAIFVDECHRRIARWSGVMMLPAGPNVHLMEWTSTSGSRIAGKAAGNKECGPRPHSK